MTAPLRPVPAAPVLHGRVAETAAVTGLLDRARAGGSGVLVLRGEAGIGKSALLERAEEESSGMRVLCGIGVPAEATLPYAGLHLLLREVGPDEIAALPPAQAQALCGALGRGTAGRQPADRYLVGLAVLTLLAELAEQRPLLCLVDDVHWFDRATVEVLVFVARRLAHESIAMIFAARDDAGFAAPGLPDLPLRRLADADARAVLDAHADDLPRRVRDLLLREAAGNPLALVELATAHRAGRLTDYPLGPPDAGHGGAPPTGGRVEREFAARVAALPRPARTLLLVAAADGSCDTGLVLSAARRLGASISDAETAERAGLLTFTSGCIGFPHPLIRAAVYGGETLGRKQAAHRALAETIDESIDPDRWAWHRAAAAIGPDEQAACALERTALRARDRGSPESAAAAYERAAVLSAEAPVRGGRLAAAAAAAAAAGQRQWAGELAERASRYLHDPVSRAQLALIDATLADADGRPQDVSRLLFTRVEEVAPVDPGLAADLLIWVVEAGWTARDLGTVRQAVQAVRRLDLPDAGHVLNLAAVVTGYLDDQDPAPDPGRQRWPPICASPDSPRGSAKMARWSLLLGDHHRAHEMASLAERAARARGELGVLPETLAVLAATRWHLGQPRDAVAAAAEGLRIARDIGLGRSVDTLAETKAQLAAVTGDEVACESALGEISPHRRTTAAATARSLLDLGAGRFDTAADRLTHVLWINAAAKQGGDPQAERPTDLTALPGGPQARAWLPDLVEAAARAGRSDLARTAATHFANWAKRVDLPWARAVALRCRALTTEGPAAGELFAEAVAMHRSEDPDGAQRGGSRPFERARTELLHGEWLRRARRRTAARAPLRAACETFDDIGATPWAARARAELRATGESRADPPPDGFGALTPQELQVVRLAAEGLSNREIAAQLFLSPRTVGYHLHKAFPKLGVASRAQLARLELPA